jgi:hypothetical protein
MAKNTRRISFTRSITYTTTVDVPGYPEETDANLLTLSGGAAGTTGTLSIGELLAGSVSTNGVISKSSWSATGTTVNVEGYLSRPQNTALALGVRVASVTPPTGYSGAIAKLFVVTAAGTTSNTSTEPNWALTDGSTTTDGTVTFRTIPKFPTLQTYPSSATAYTVGQIVRPSSTSLKEFLVITAGTTSASTAFLTNDTVGTQFTDGAVFVCIAGAKTYANLTAYALGDVVKPSSASTQEYLVTAAGASDASSSLSIGSVGSSATIGTVTFKRMV